MPKPDRTIEIYPDEGGRYRWRARAKNGKVTAVSGESFDSKGNAKKAAKREYKPPYIQHGVEIVEIEE